MNSFVYILSGAAVLGIIALVIKRPDIIKKDPQKPLSVSNFSFKKSFIGDWKKFGAWALLMFLVWSYAHDTQGCREMIENIDEICMQWQEQQTLSMSNVDYNQLNLGEVINGNNTDNSGRIAEQGSSNNVP